MLNLLPWIILTFKDVFWTKEEDKGGLSNDAGRSNHQLKDVEKVPDYDENSLDDILEDTAWRAVSGYSENSNEDLDYKDMDSSFGDVFDGPDVKRAVLIKRNSQTLFETDRIKNMARLEASPSHGESGQQGKQPKQAEKSMTYLSSSPAKRIDKSSTSRVVVIEETMPESVASICNSSISEEEERTYLRRNDSWESINVNPTIRMPEQNMDSSINEPSVFVDADNDNHRFHGDRNLSKNPEIASNIENTKDSSSKTTPKKMILEGHIMGQHGVYTDSPKAIYNEFDEIMHKRKLHTDTMQRVSDTFGNLGNRDDKIFGVASQQHASPLWQKVRVAVKNKTYLHFQGIQNS